MLLGGVFIIIAWVYLGPSFIDRMAQSYRWRGWTPYERVLTELRVVIFYLSLLLYPHPSRLNLDHDFSVSHSLFSPFSTFGSFLFIAGLLSLAIFLVRRNRFIAYALLWFLGNLVIESSVIPLELVFEHRMYLPSMGIFMLVAGVGVGVGSGVWRRGVMGVMMVVIVLCSYWTYERAFVWREPFSLWMNAVQKSPHKARPHNNLGQAYREKGMLDEAISQYKKALAINPNHAEIHSNLGVVYAQKGMLDEAIGEYMCALEIDPNYAKAHTNLGNVYVRKGMLDEAILEHKKALTINPNHAEVHSNLGVVYAQKGMLDEAISEYKKALTINPNHTKIHTNLGNVYAQKGMLDEAILEHKEALTINPNLAEAHHSIANIYAKEGIVDEAIAEYKKTLSINPNLAEVHFKLGSLIEAQSKFRDAVSAYRETIRLNPNFLLAYNNLAWIYATSPDATIRNGDEAVALANTACKLTEFKNAGTLDTLAAAYAEQGIFEKAIEYQNKAIELAPSQAKRELEVRLQLYEKGYPYRNP